MLLTALIKTDRWNLDDLDEYFHEKVNTWCIVLTVNFLSNYQLYKQIPWISMSSTVCLFSFHLHFICLCLIKIFNLRFTQILSLICIKPWFSMLDYLQTGKFSLHKCATEIKSWPPCARADREICAGRYVEKFERGISCDRSRNFTHAIANVFISLIPIVIYLYVA